MRKRSVQFVAGVIALLPLVGCKDDSAQKNQAGNPPPVPAGGQPTGSPTAVRARGFIRGRVVFSGPRPATQPVAQSICHRTTPLPDETLLVAGDGGLKNVFVYLKEKPEGAADPGPSAIATLDQVECQYVPHALAVQVGQVLTVKSSDATLHNVHSQPKLNPPVNLAMTRAGDTKEMKFPEAEIVPVGCDVHPWMRAWVGVFDHPYFAVTGDDGRFEINNVPAGPRTLAVWHERLGPQEKPVTVKADAPAEATFTFEVK